LLGIARHALDVERLLRYRQPCQPLNFDLEATRTFFVRRGKREHGVIHGVDTGSRSRSTQRSPAASDRCCGESGKSRDSADARGVSWKKPWPCVPPSMGMVKKKAEGSCGLLSAYVLMRRVFPSRKTSRSGEFFHTHLIRVSTSNTQQYIEEHGRASKSQQEP